MANVSLEIFKGSDTMITNFTGKDVPNQSGKTFFVTEDGRSKMSG